jgi:hypothetical protein
MFALLLAVSLSQAGGPRTAPATEPLPVFDAPAPAEEPEDEGDPTTASLAPQRRAAPEVSQPRRVLLAGLAGVAGSFAGLGLSVALAGQNPAFDTTFATALLAPMLLTGVTFVAHQLLGGRGEIILAYAAALACMAGAAGLATAIDGRTPFTPVLATLIGALPAAAGAVLVLEATTRTSARAPHLAVLPTGLAGVF